MCMPTDNKGLSDKSDNKGICDRMFSSKILIASTNFLGNTDDIADKTYFYIKYIITF